MGDPSSRPQSSPLLWSALPRRSSVGEVSFLNPQELVPAIVRADTGLQLLAFNRLGVGPDTLNERTFLPLRELLVKALVFCQLGGVDLPAIRALNFQHLSFS